MATKIENIGKKDVMWGYASTIFTIGAGVILLPFILYKLEASTVGLWNIFQTITSLIFLLDFGFRPSFARNISYIFSGVKQLQKEGVANVEEDAQPDYGLLKGTLTAMRKFYMWMAVAVFVILSTAGTAYFYYILQKYTGDKQDALVAWILLITINCYNLYTLYYDALLTGKGYIRQTQQITILGQAVYLIVAICLLYAGFGLTAIVAAQLLSTVIRRIITYRVFFTKEIKHQLSIATEQNPQDIISAIFPNAVKVGLTSLGAFLVNKSAVLIGSAFLPLAVVASYGISVQVLDILSRCGAVYYQSFVPKLAQYRAERDIPHLRKIYRYSTLSLIAIFLAGGLAFVYLGDWALQIIRSDTHFLEPAMLAVMIVIHFLEQNHVVAAGFIMADNKIPFFIPSLVSGAATVVLLWVFLSVAGWGVWGMILAPGIAQLAYQNWKWPSVVIKELREHKEINNQS